LELDEIIRKITEEVYEKMREGEALPATKESSALSGKIEYARLNPAAKIQDIREACETVRKKGYGSLCVPQWFVNFARESLEGCNVPISTFVGLPGGTSSTYAKYAEVKEAVKNGAGEVNIPVNMELIKKGKTDAAVNDLNGAKVPAVNKAKVAAVIETGSIDEQQLETAIGVALNCGVEYICLSGVLSSRKIGIAEVKKTSGMIGGKSKLKVMGGIDSAAFANELISAGAGKLTTSCNF
jgi:deoxyribose-phosphate aldolase